MIENSSEQISIIWDCEHACQEQDALGITTDGKGAAFPVYIYRNGKYEPIITDEGHPALIVLPGTYQMIPVRWGD